MPKEMLKSQVIVESVGTIHHQVPWLGSNGGTWLTPLILTELRMSGVPSEFVGVPI